MGGPAPDPDGQRRAVGAEDDGTRLHADEGAQLLDVLAPEDAQVAAAEEEGEQCDALSFRRHDCWPSCENLADSNPFYAARRID